MEKFAIESNVPIPEVTRTRESKYPFADMELKNPEQSFYVPESDEKKRSKLLASISSGASRVGKNLDRKFTVQNTGKGVRCWRIAKTTKAAANGAAGTVVKNRKSA